MKAKNKSFSGGYTFNLEGKSQSKVVELEVPSKVIIPLKQGFSREVKPKVKRGQEVKAGQIIGRDDNSISTPVHASVNGTVKEVVELSSKGKAVIIESDGTTDWEPIEGNNSGWTSLSAAEIEELLYTSGVTSLGNQGIPTRYKSSPISTDDVKHVIIKGAESEPYNLLLSALLNDGKVSKFVEGLEVLQKVLPQAKFHVVINKNRQGIIKELSSVAGSYNWLQLYAVAPKYPQNNDKVIAQTVLGKSDTVKGSLTKHGVITLDMQAALHVYNAVIEGKQLIEQIVALSGLGWKENISLKVRNGTSVSFIMRNYLDAAEDQRVIPNNLLTEEAITDYETPVDRTFVNLNAIPEGDERELFAFLRPGRKRYSYSNVFLSALLPKLNKLCDTNVHGEGRPCISCGYCEETCPVDIVPHIVDHYTAKNNVDDELIRYGIFDCIECNLCTFVCPAKRPLGQHIKQGKQFLMNKGYAVK
ncbi:4Fe-4S dicluster domain-containing protein [Selenihalanaerobacter shriftii]|uniref:4Fe-4S dicluster domain-containing protein n=1 Tax=Selenihalanaerobacter shriftii TaxID=142842 RepID=A0A1T4PU47_9FIRM|nr:4Fe-4S dicluster domain-containing protein [Selenihalanaerobacter shriftii]SJZ95085.1 4Fe-4S dicluster domain-containing protein [Selenihalanaerobacter shriftii]